MGAHIGGEHVGVHRIGRFHHRPAFQHIVAVAAPGQKIEKHHLVAARRIEGPDATLFIHQFCRQQAMSLGQSRIETVAQPRGLQQPRALAMLRVRADHAAAQDSVFSDVDEEFVRRNGFVSVKTLCESKDQYITRPDLGRKFGPEAQNVIKNTYAKGTSVILMVGDGLPSAAIEANVEDCIPAIKQGLKLDGLDIGDILFVKYCRVGAMDAVGDLTDADVICMLVGERPGLVTAESMSAYITYKPKTGIAEAKRTVISNIHKGGTNAVEAGAHIAKLIGRMLREKASGVDLK